MRIEFDTSNAAELMAVGALIASLRGESPTVTAHHEFDPMVGVGPDGRILLRSEREAIDDAAANGYGEPATVFTQATADASGAFDAPLAPPVPVSPAVPPVPTGITAPPAQSPGGVELDADGLPYDQRIHSTPASKKKDGCWRGKRGLDDATRDAVTAELRAALAAPGVGADPLPVSAPPVDAATAFAAPVAAPAIEPVAPPPPPVAAVAPPPPPPAPVAEPVAAAPPANDFAGLMRKITALQTAGVLDVSGTQQIAASLGIAGVRDLMVRPDLIPSFEALLPVAA